MKIRVIYNDIEIISVDKPDGAAAIDYEKYNLAIADHTQLLPTFYDFGFDISAISRFLMSEGVQIEDEKWLPKIV